MFKLLVNHLVLGSVSDAQNNLLNWRHFGLNFKPNICLLHLTLNCVLTILIAKQDDFEIVLKNVLIGTQSPPKKGLKKTKRRFLVPFGGVRGAHIKTLNVYKEYLKILLQL